MDELNEWAEGGERRPALQALLEVEALADTRLLYQHMPEELKPRGAGSLHDERGPGRLLWLAPWPSAHPGAGPSAQRQFLDTLTPIVEYELGPLGRTHGLARRWTTIGRSLGGQIKREPRLKAAKRILTQA